MTAEIVQHTSTLAEQIDYAKVVSVGSLLPREYQNNPANVLIAVGLGSSMGLSPAESLYRITVIQGKPTASAELIAANVRKAGHKLRVKVTENPPSATCTIIRADDPDEPTTVTRDMAWASAMGLTGKDNYKKQPSTMLAWRAISACARLACPEALYGVTYTPDEVGDGGPAQATQSRGLGAVLAQPQSEPVDVTDAEIVEDRYPAEGEPPADPITDAQMRKLHATFNEVGITDRADRLAYVASTIGREVESSKDLTKDEARAVIDLLISDADR